MSERIVIVGGARTPFVRARTVYKNMPAAMLGGVALREAVARTGLDPKVIDEVYFGIVSGPAEGTNVAREAVFDAGLPSSINATTVNRYCASSMETTAGIAAKIIAGQIEVGVSGGVEAISQIRALFSLQATNFFQDAARARSFGERLGFLRKFKLGYLAPQAPGIKEPTLGLSMGQSADLMAREWKISRDAQDQYALKSHQKAAAAWERGFYSSHVVPVGTPDGKVVDRDTDVRADSSLEKMKTLKPVFYKDGTITAANASPLTDGASAAILMKESKARELGLRPLGALKAYATHAIDLAKEGLLIAPAHAIPKALKQVGVGLGQIDLFEIHEAFAAQVLCTLEALKKNGTGEIDPDKMNVNGGSIPIGHPFGATGTRLVLQTLHELRARKKNLGLISVCAAGGLGAVMVLEALD